MMSSKFLVRIAISTIITVLVFTSCGDRGAETVGKDKIPGTVKKVESNAVPIAVPDTGEALIVFLTGEAAVVGPSGERVPEIGDTVVAGESVVTGSDGYIELQFGNLGAVHINENTEYVLDSLSLSDDGSRASGSLAAGSVISKVRKLSGSDTFEINVPGAVCAVRGTEFLVRSDNTGSITIAVIEGSVAVVPPPLWPPQAPHPTMRLRLGQSEP